MGLFGGKKTTTQTSSTSSTSSSSMPVIEDWVRNSVQKGAGLIDNIAGADPYSFVAPPDPLMMQAGQGAAGLTGRNSDYERAMGLVSSTGGRGPSTYQAATGAATGYDPTQFAGAQLGAAGNGGAASLLTDLDKYMSPYRKNVVDAALADYDFGAGQTRAQQDLDLAGAGAFGGSGAALTRSMTEDALVRGRASTSSKLYDDMYRFGAEMSDRDANRRQQMDTFNVGANNQFALSQAGFDQETGLSNMAAVNQARQFGAGAQNDMTQFNLGALNRAGEYNAGALERAWDRDLNVGQSLANIAGAYEAGQRSNYQTQMQLGQGLREVDQQYRRAPIENANQVVAMLGNVPFQMFAGQNTTGTTTANEKSVTKKSGVSLGDIVKIAQAAASMATTGVPA